MKDSREQSPELIKILNQHAEWLESEGHDGRRAYLVGFEGDNLDLRKVDLRRADLSNSSLKNAILDKANLRGASISRANLESASLRGANLDNCDLAEANLRQADLTGATLRGTDLTRASIEDANLSKAKLKNTLLEHAILDDADLEYAEILGTDFRNASMNRTALSHAIIENTNFAGASLIESNIAGSLILGAEMEGTNLTNVRVTGAIVSGVDLGEVRLGSINIEPVMYENEALPRLTGITDIRAFHKVQEGFITGKIGRSWVRPGRLSGRGVSQMAASHMDSVVVRHSTEEGVVIKVMYATNRVPYGKELPEDPYTNKRCKTTHYGVVNVDIPDAHELGKLERPGLLDKLTSVVRFVSGQKPAEYFKICRHKRYEDKDVFFDALKKDILNSNDRNAFIFIHGYNVTFADSVLRAAQFANDLKMRIAPIVYSWPSRGRVLWGKLGVNAYIEDEERAAWSVHYLEKFLEDVADKIGEGTVHLIAHSMGNRILSQALEHMALKEQGRSEVKFKQIVLAAPDIGADIFLNMSQAISSQANKVTIYGSSKDTALKFSTKLHNFSRLGDTKAKVLIIPGIDTVDASNMDATPMFAFGGHSYFSKLRPLLNDLYALLVDEKEPSGRFDLGPAYIEGDRYWIFRR